VARLIVGGTDYELRPFKFRELRQAAPAIDRIAGRARLGAGGLAAMTEGLNDLLEVLAIGLEDRSAEDLAADLCMTEVAGVQVAFVSLLTESGLKPMGEFEPASALIPASADPAPNAPSPNRSMTSSPNSSAPAAATGTG
jgi:hypothetical protein